MTIQYLDRDSKKIEEENVYGGRFLAFLYKNTPFSNFLLYFVARSPFISMAYGWFMRSRFSKRLVKSFIEKYKIDMRECVKKEFDSFNDFFTRRVQPRKLPYGSCLPADARYLAFSDAKLRMPFFVKETAFDVKTLLGKPFDAGAILIARLCPTDYHRYHFITDCKPVSVTSVKGSLYSVNPLAVQMWPWIYWENKREVIELETYEFGTVYCVAVGATNVGTIHHAFECGRWYEKGEEMGHFSFGGSCLIYLFEKGRMYFSEDLVDATKKGLEVRGKYGQALDILEQTGHS